MALDGFVYYYGKNNLSPTILESYVNFNDFTSGSPGFFAVESGNPLYYINQIGQTGANSISGSGYLHGGIFEVNSGDLLEKSDFSAMLIFEKKTAGQQILLSTLSQTNAGTSGFIFGVNDANKLYITTHNPDAGFEHFVFNTSLGKKNGVALCKDNNNFSLLKFNFFEKEIYEERATFSNDCLTEGSGFFLGGMSGFVTGISNNLFNGYIDEFVFIDQPLNSSYISGLFRGMASNTPRETYGITSNFSKYTYNGLTSMLRAPEFEALSSGALDYIQANIFNMTGIGTISVLSSGVVTSNVAHVSGNLSGYVTLPTGYYVLNSGQRVTGYTFSGQVPAATGITGYTLVNLNPFAAYDHDKYIFSGYSGLTGVTRWQDVYSGALYETYYTSGFVSTGIRTLYNFPFSFNLSGMSGAATYTHLARYTNNGNDKILIQHDLTYSGSVGQTTPFRVLKDNYLSYGTVYAESAPDFNFVTGFSMDGITIVYPIATNWNISMDYPVYSGDYRLNKELISDYSSGMFKTSSVEDALQMFVFVNGKNLTNVGSGADFVYNGTYLDDAINYDRLDISIVDFFSGAQASGSALASGTVSGVKIFNVGTPSGFVFLNGQKLISGVDYSGLLVSKTNQYSGIGGYKWLTIPSGLWSLATGSKPSLVKVVPEMGTMVYANGLRQKLKKDYVEVSEFDIIYNITGNVDVNYESIFNSENFVI